MFWVCLEDQVWLQFMNSMYGSVQFFGWHPRTALIFEHRCSQLGSRYTGAVYQEQHKLVTQSHGKMWNNLKSWIYWFVSTGTISVLFVLLVRNSYIEDAWLPLVRDFILYFFQPIMYKSLLLALQMHLHERRIIHISSPSTSLAQHMWLLQQLNFTYFSGKKRQKWWSANSMFCKLVCFTHLNNVLILKRKRKGKLP